MQKILLTIFLIINSIHGVGVAEGFIFEPIPAVKYPPDNPWSKEKHVLGKKLFFDPVLSGDNSISCSTCHKPELGWTDGLPRSKGFKQKELTRNAPTIINSAFNKSQFWDGRKPSLEEQAKAPIQSPVEMNQDIEELIAELNAIKEYPVLFSKAFGEKGINLDKIAMAIATFERSIISRTSPYDRYWKGDQNALSVSAKKGMKLFFGKAKCSICHTGPLFTDQQFHNIGTPRSETLDSGRNAVTGEAFHIGAFKTPGLRDLSATGPYMHNGTFNTLEEVIEFYDMGGEEDENKSPFISRIGLNVIEKKSLIDFLKSLISDEAQEYK